MEGYVIKQKRGIILLFMLFSFLGLGYGLYLYNTINGMLPIFIIILFLPLALFTHLKVMRPKVIMNIDQKGIIFERYGLIEWRNIMSIYIAGTPNFDWIVFNVAEADKYAAQIPFWYKLYTLLTGHRHAGVVVAFTGTGYTSGNVLKILKAYAPIPEIIETHA